MSTYAAAYKALAFATVPQVMRNREYKAALQTTTSFLEGSVRADGAIPTIISTTRPWAISEPQTGTIPTVRSDCWAFGPQQDAGVEINVNYWRLVNNHWRNTEQADGTWRYGPQEISSALNMTTAGVASMYITTEGTDMDPPQLVGKDDPGLEAGLTWIKRNFDPGKDMYGLYGCERVGLASGLKYFGTHNWFQEGAAAIIKAQKRDGSSGLDDMKFGEPVSNTAYALLFLCHGRNPILFNKLEYHNPTDPKPLIWNARPRDLDNLTHHYSKMFEQDFNWQVVSLQVPVEEWLDAPVLLITGSRDPHFTPQDVANLKTFVDDGGLIFSSADGGTQEFTNAIKKYAAQLVNGHAQMRELPKDHCIYNLQYTDPNPPPMLGLSNGIRELWIHSPGDMGAIWQMRASSHRACWDIPANIYLYATGKVNSRQKFQNLAIAPGKATTVRNIALARINYTGNWDPEPGAWPRMAQLAQAQFHTNLQISDVKIQNLDPHKTPLAHLTGTTEFTLAPEDVAALKQYLDGGGTLLVDAGGGSDAFNDSFTKLAAQLFPKDSLDTLPPDNPVITGKITDGTDASTVDFRRNTLKKSGPPPLQALQHNGRYVIYYSPLDLSSGLLGTNTWGILGYTPDSAQAVLRNMLLVSAK